MVSVRQGYRIRAFRARDQLIDDTYAAAAVVDLVGTPNRMLDQICLKGPDRVTLPAWANPEIGNLQTSI